MVWTGHLITPESQLLQGQTDYPCCVNGPLELWDTGALCEPNLNSLFLRENTYVLQMNRQMTPHPTPSRLLWEILALFKNFKILYKRNSAIFVHNHHPGAIISPTPRNKIDFMKEPVRPRPRIPYPFNSERSDILGFWATASILWFSLTLVCRRMEEEKWDVGNRGECPPLCCNYKWFFIQPELPDDTLLLTKSHPCCWLIKLSLPPSLFLIYKT